MAKSKKVIFNKFFNFNINQYFYPIEVDLIGSYKQPNIWFKLHNDMSLRHLQIELNMEQIQNWQKR